VAKTSRLAILCDVIRIPFSTIVYDVKVVSCCNDVTCIPFPGAFDPSRP